MGTQNMVWNLTLTRDKYFLVSAYFKDKNVTLLKTFVQSKDACICRCSGKHFEQGGHGWKPDFGAHVPFCTLYDLHVIGPQRAPHVRKKLGSS